ncbi:hypothetical protein EVAR_24189_1 [Eumeta japonica]|uniref:Uncharacterized protein n=1 Tax=Eumeta variegata TaxID=151549 RepID=A0A4C1W3A9_EUMVA|nr:hypothetical protein EVAR_24189_1 [Eumeta japonica]
MSHAQHRRQRTTKKNKRSYVKTKRLRPYRCHRSWNAKNNTTLRFGSVVSTSAGRRLIAQATTYGRRHADNHTCCALNLFVGRKNRHLRRIIHLNIILSLTREHSARSGERRRELRPRRSHGDETRNFCGRRRKIKHYSRAARCPPPLLRRASRRPPAPATALKKGSDLFRGNLAARS